MRSELQGLPPADVDQTGMKNRHRLIVALLAGALFIVLSFGAKWVIFSTVLEKDETGRQPEARYEPKFKGDD